MVVSETVTTSAPATARRTATARGKCRPWRILTKGASTKLIRTASTMGTSISREKYNVARTIAITTKLLKTSAAGTITTCFRVNC